MTTDNPTIGIDQPLKVGSALVKDKLSRLGFARLAAGSLKKVSSSDGFVMSIEGVWGSGKTSTLAMIEELLSQEPQSTRPVVVHFNPWLVGDRDALLRQFLSKLATAIALADHAKDGKKVAKEIKAYANAFNVLKLIPGAEPWASIVKSVLTSVGDTTDAIAEHKTKDIEQHKSRVEAVLAKFPRPIIVFIDDIDRLFPLEVFEMIRIVKAVGELPNVGYVLSWDPAYVAEALRSANVPYADSYLDKIVQARMPLPSLSASAKESLINEAMSSLGPEATATYFQNDSERLWSLYYSGLREMFAQPRDVTRIFNTVALIEPALRGEVVFSDIVGLAAMMVKAPPVFELLKNKPKYFVGQMPGDMNSLEKSKEISQAGSTARNGAFAQCANPEDTRRVVRYLFPITAKADDKFTSDRVVDVEGHLAHPARLLVALQMSVSPTDISLVLARRFIVDPGHRTEVLGGITQQTAYEFMEAIGDLASSMGDGSVTNPGELCMTVAELADSAVFATRAKDRSGGFGHRAEAVAIRAIEEIVKATNPDTGPAVAAKIVEGGRALSVSAHLLGSAHLEGREKNEVLNLPQDVVTKEKILTAHVTHVMSRMNEGTFFATANPGLTLWMHGRIAPAACKKLFEAARTADSTLDAFAMAFLGTGFDSTKGQTYSLPQDQQVMEAYCPLEDFRLHAQSRLADSSVDYPVRAAWRSVVENKRLYGLDGSESWP